MSERFTRRDDGVDFELDVERTALLPGRTVAAIVRFTPGRDVEVRGIVAALVADEHWQYERTETDREGHTRTVTETRHEEHRRLPVVLAGPGRYAKGTTTVLPFEVPVPPLGPASFGATVTGLAWRLEVKLDVPGFDPSIEIDVRVLQPTGLLRAGAIAVGAFGLFGSADAEADGVRGAIDLEPVPLCIGAPFSGQLRLAAHRPARLQEIRVELRVAARSTVSSGKREELTVWAGRVGAEGEYGGTAQVIAFAGELPLRDLPTIRLPHGAADAQLHVILARPWAPDTHLVRDVAVCSTTEL